MRKEGDGSISSLQGPGHCCVYSHEITVYLFSDAIDIG